MAAASEPELFGAALTHLTSAAYSCLHSSTNDFSDLGDEVLIETEEKHILNLITVHAAP